MQRFQFPLDRVRRWRAGQAMFEELKLEQMRRNLQALGEEKQSIASERSRNEREVLGQSAVEAAQLQSLDAYRLHTRGKIRDIENRERQAEAEVDEQRQRVVVTRRDAELLERLKCKARDEWQAASDREQDTLATDLYLAKRVRR
jgi:flagellar biosynthesis chaperone FliJ